MSAPPPPAHPPERCRLVLILSEAGDSDELSLPLAEALRGGDVASVIVPQGVRSEGEFQAICESIVPLAQGAGAAVMVAGDSRIAGRVGADGLHVETGFDAVAAAVNKANGRTAVGAGGARTRDEALALGEAEPDYLFFGRFGYDTTPEPHPRNLALGRWWAEMIAIPCIVMAGSDLASLETVASTGAEFAAVSRAVFGDGADPREAVRRANDLLDRSAPRIEDAS